MIIVEQQQQKLQQLKFQGCSYYKISVAKKNQFDT